MKAFLKYPPTDYILYEIGFLFEVVFSGSAYRGLSQYCLCEVRAYNHIINIVIHVVKKLRI